MRLLDFWQDLRRVTIETRVGPIIGVERDAPAESRPALRTELDLLNGSIRHERAAAHRVGPAARAHGNAVAASEAIRASWPDLARRFRRLDARLEALPETEEDAL